MERINGQYRVHMVSQEEKLPIISPQELKRIKFIHVEILWDFLSLSFCSIKDRCSNEHRLHGLLGAIRPDEPVVYSQRQQQQQHPA